MFGIASGILRRLNGLDGNPKRIDTGRYRAAWAVGTKEATGMTLPVSTSASESGDGVGVRTATAITVTNNVEYGPYIEYGTEHMAAGLHVADAVEAEGRTASKVIGGEFARAWRA